MVGAVVLLCFCLIIYSLAFRAIPESNKEIFIHTIGIVEGAVIGIVTYYYGSSSGSKAKTDILEDIAKKNTP